MKWSYTTTGGIVSSPAIGSDGTVYIGSADNKLYAVNSTGTTKWSYNTGGIIYSSPAVDNGRGVVFIANNSGEVYAINTTGTFKWQQTAIGGAKYSSPALASPNNIVYIGDENGKFYAIDGTNGAIICYNTHNWPITSTAIDSPSGGKYCVWYNELSVALRKICSTQAGAEENCNCKRQKLALQNEPNPFTTSNKNRFHPAH